MIDLDVFEVPTGRILGAQAIGTGETDKRINVQVLPAQFCPVYVSDC